MLKNLLPATFAFVTLFWGCSNDDSSSSANVKPFEGSIEGVSQKGPLLVGASVTVQELDGISLAQTGKSYRGKVMNDKGMFSVENVNLESPYVLLEANGYFRNEVTGEKSKGSILMRAVADMTDRSQVNVNLLTHLEYERVQVLLSQGNMSFAEAKREADREIFAAFFNADYDEKVENLDIFGNSEGDAALLAINILLLGEESESVFMERFAKLGQDLADDGVWNDSLLKAAIADWACKADLLESYPEIRKNIMNWEISENVAAFEPYVRSFWEDLYGLGKCNESSLGQSKVNSYKASEYFGMEFVCDESGRWSADIKAVLGGCDSCGILKDSRNGFVYRTVKMAGLNWMGENLREESSCPDGWRLPTSRELKRLLESTESDEHKELFSQTGWNAQFLYYGDTLLYLTSTYEKNVSINLDMQMVLGISGSTDSLKFDWFGYLESSIYASEIYIRCVENDSIPRKMLPPEDAIVGTFKDERNGVVYKTVTLGDQVWMAQNLDYEMDSTSCVNVPHTLFECSGANPNCYTVPETCSLGRGYSWYDARVACPEGWRLPSNADVEKLLDAVGGAYGAAPYLTSGFEGSEDVYGFSALPTEYQTSKYYRLGVSTSYWTSDSLMDAEFGEMAYLWSLDRYDASLGAFYPGVYSTVRCMKDRE